MTAGSRNRLIVFERQDVATTNDYGDERPGTWSPFADAFAEVIFSKGSERREAAQTSAVASATFRVLDNPDTRAVTPKDRIVFDGSAWDIKGNVPSRELNAKREITATRKVA